MSLPETVLATPASQNLTLPDPAIVGIGLLDPAREALAQILARRFGLEVFRDIDWKCAPKPLMLVLDAQGVALQQTGSGAPGPVRASFVDGAVEHRRRFGGGQGQMIAKAVGLNQGVRPQVVDATAGLGRDAWVLASLGCQVTMLERSPLVALLLEQGLADALSGEQAEIAQRLQVQWTDSAQWLAQQPDRSIEVIYLDPMYPHRDKSASVKKEMAIFQRLLGQDEDAAGLLGLALCKARHRVVVKRPRKGELLGGRAPHYQLEGKSCRYDVFSLLRF